MLLIFQCDPFLNTSLTDLHNIREIDGENLTAEVERGVPLDKLINGIRDKGLIFAPFTPDIGDLTVGDFFSQQIGSLASFKYGNPKLHVMGLEVVLANGETVKTGGKTVKNVTGYDMTKVFLSSRETIGIPRAYILKLLPQEEASKYYLISLSNYEKLGVLYNKIVKEKIIPAASCFWSSQDNSDLATLLIGLNGVKERVKIDEHLLVQVVSSIGESINEVYITILNQLWQNIRELRINSNWLDGFKVPPEKIPQFIKEIKKVNIPTEHWGNPLQGNVNIILLQGQETKDTYLKLKEITEKLGGATSWYYDSKYGLLDPRINGMLQHIQRKFDPQGVFGPTGGE